MTVARTIRRLLDGALMAFVVVVVGLVLLAVLGPAIGHRPIVIRGGSMSPAIPLGSLIDVVQVDPGELAVGDVVTIKAPNGVLITHRITRVQQATDGLYFEVKGDANAQPDPTVVPASAIVGRVGFSVPYLGFLLYMITTPAGFASILSLALTLLFAIWLLEDLEDELARRRPRPARPDPWTELVR
jgi:signal peptidase